MRVDVWSDIVCPWCAVGNARLRTALDAFAHRDEVRIRWRSFELDPTAPRVREGDYAARLAAKYGVSVADAGTMIDRMTQTAAAEGLDFHFERIRPGNSFDAHRLLHLAADRGLQHPLKERLLTAYLTEGEAIGLPEVLQRLATEVGVDEVEVKDVLAGDAYAEAVRADERQAMEYGITGVPCFVIDGRFAVPGAQPPERLLQAFERAWSPRAPLTDHDPTTDHGPNDDADDDTDDGHGHAHGPGEACVDGACQR